MPKSCYVGLDQGSNSSKAIILDSQGRELWQRSIPISTTTTATRVTQNPEELYKSIKSVLDGAIKWATKNRLRIKAIGLSCQRSGVLAWNSSSGKVLHPMLSWRDLSTQNILNSVRSRSRYVTKKTGIPFTAHYAAPKISTLQAKFKSKKIFIATLDTFLINRLSDQRLFVTEDTMASRTMLYDLKLGNWDPRLCKIFGVDISRLPEIRPSLGDFGTYHGIPIIAALGDQQASYFGRATKENSIILNMGTVSSLIIPTNNKIVKHKGYSSSVLKTSRRSSGKKSSTYFIESMSNASASVIDYIVKDLKLAKSAGSIQKILQDLNPDSYIPIAFAPLGGTASPYWKTGIPTKIVSWDKNDKAGAVRALVENIANFVLYNVFRLKRAGLIPSSVSQFYISGGISEIDYLVQYLADVSNLTIFRASSKEASARGAGIAALIATNPRVSISKLNSPNRVFCFYPQKSGSKQRYLDWARLYKSLISK